MKKFLFLFILPLLFSATLLAQSREIKGNVVDAKGNPLEGASVVLKATNKGVKTNSKGDFTLQVKVGKESVYLTISYVGYKTQLVEARGDEKLAIKMELSAEVVGDEVVVIGYQTIKRKDLMASASTISSKELKENPLTNTAEALQGKLAGVQITMSEGNPGATATVNIRGRNSITGSGDPLYIVDGQPVDNALSVINPQDIESMDVLKDAASTAIYGSRGANGVVVITTKSGKNSSGRMNVNYNSSFGVQKLAKELAMMGPYDFVLYQYERGQWVNDTAAANRYIGSPNNYDTIKNFYKNLKGIDWQHETMGKSVFQQTHNVSLSGGDAVNTYNLSLTANLQDGILINTNINKKLANFKFEHKQSTQLRFGFGVRYLDQLVNGAGTSDAGGASTNNLRQYVRYRPLLLPGQGIDSYDESLLDNNTGNGITIVNPILLSNAQTRRAYTSVFNLNGFLQYTLMKNVNFRANLGYDLNSVNNKSYDDTLTGIARKYGVQPVLTFNNTKVITLTNSNTLTYTNTSIMGTKNSVNVLLGQEIVQKTKGTDNLELHYFPVGTSADQAFNNLQLAPASSSGLIQPKPSSSSVPDNLASFFTSIDYNYNQRYFAKVNFRADGSSIFSSQNAWGYFPSASVAWRISREDFFKSSIINDLRLRLSYGTAGNNKITPYSFKEQYTYPAGSGYGLNNALTNVLIPSNLENKGLKWETQVSKNLGIDLSLFQSRVNITIDGYSNQSKDLLLLQTIPSSTGYNTQYQNIGATTNTGLEIQISGNVMRKRGFGWDASFNISFNKNKITSLGPNQQLLRNSGWFSSTNGQPDYELKVGEEVGTMFGYVNDGFYKLSDFDKTPFSNAAFPTFTTLYSLKKGVTDASAILPNPIQPGSAKFKDMNGDGKIDANDRTIIGHSQPKFFGGLLQTFTYRNFTLSVFLNYSVGNDIFNANKVELSSAYGSEVNMLAINSNRWKMIDANGNSIQKAVTIGSQVQVIGADSATIANTNKNASIWFPSNSTSAYFNQSFAVENGSFLRINNISLGYNIPKKLLTRAKIAALRLYATVNNVAMFTKYTGYDPDVNSRRNDPTTIGVDYSAYPRARTYVVGLNLTL